MKTIQATTPTMITPESSILQIYSTKNGIVIEAGKTCNVPTDVTITPHHGIYMQINHPDKNSQLTILKIDRSTIEDDNHLPVIICAYNPTPNEIIIKEEYCITNITHYKRQVCDITVTNKQRISPRLRIDRMENSVNTITPQIITPPTTVALMWLGACCHRVLDS